MKRWTIVPGDMIRSSLGNPFRMTYTWSKLNITVGDLVGDIMPVFADDIYLAAAVVECRYKLVIPLQVRKYVLLIRLGTGTGGLRWAGTTEKWDWEKI